MMRFRYSMLFSAIAVMSSFSCGDPAGNGNGENDSLLADSTDTVKNKRALHTRRANDVTGDQLLDLWNKDFNAINHFLWNEKEWRLREKKDLSGGVMQATWASDHDPERISDMITFEYGKEYETIIVFRTYKLESYGEVMATMGLSNFTRAKYMKTNGIEKKCLEDKSSNRVICVRNPGTDDKSEQFVITITTKKNMDYIWLDSEHLSPAPR